jgi:SAM-dependent methyltransferase
VPPCGTMGIGRLDCGDPGKLKGVNSSDFEGSQTELYLHLTDVGESQLVHRAVASGASILELGCGTGRMTRGLLDLGHPVTAVDNKQEMLSHLPETAAAVLSDIETLVLKTSFPVVLLASNLINNPDQGIRSKLLATCRSHVSEEGVVVLQRYQPGLDGWEPGDWVERGSVAVRIFRFERQGDHFSASIEYRRGDQAWTQHFSAVVLDDETLRAELALSGLRLERMLDPEGSWVLATP